MIAHIEKVRATPWHLVDTSLAREFFFVCDEGEFKSIWDFSIKEGPKGGLVPFTTIRLGWPLNPDENQDKLWFVTRLVRGNEVGASVVMQCFEKGRSSILTSVEKDTFSELSSALMDEGDWSLEIHGESGIIAGYPMPNNSNFSAQFSRLLELGRQANSGRQA